MASEPPENESNDPGPRRYGRPLSANRLRRWAYGLLTPPGMWGLTQKFEPHPAAVLSMLALGVLGTGLAFVMAGRIFARVGPTRGAIFTYLIPIVSIVLGAAIRNDRIQAVHLVGVALVLVGAFVSSRAGRRRQPGAVVAGRVGLWPT